VPVYYTIQQITDYSFIEWHAVYGKLRFIWKLNCIPQIFITNNAQLSSYARDYVHKVNGDIVRL